MKSPPEVSSAITGRLPHMPQLDGLRALAVAAVLIHHYTLNGWGVGANWGVKLFFVLSGFLITSILIRSRNAAESKGPTKGPVLRRFYARRSFRIFPLYFFVIAVAVLINLEPVKEYLPWLVTYTLNIRMAQQGWYIDHFAHFWTLCIEEQFYLFWPLLMLLVPRKWLLPVTIGMILVGPLYRLYHVLGWRYFDSQATGLRTYIFTFASFDSLGMGALLAILWHLEYPKEKIRRHLTWTVLPIGLAGLLILKMIQQHPAGWEYDLVFGDLFLALVFAWLICVVAIGFKGVLGSGLEFSPLRYLGKISYGIYVYHPFMPTLLIFLFALFGQEYSLYSWSGFALATLMTLLVSSLSWHILESPMNDLKRHIA